MKRKFGDDEEWAPLIQQINDGYVLINECEATVEQKSKF